ncbi:hypothetical protein EIN_205920 [Entamoeba invadens IP1]|uniref:RING-CH-type domain-containing protein n=1 Tax=Entamoeba invadens IP1 TaxID=370355 RepID=A0A0A1UD06_ENTIV|nr:hypothetical protein EIN_205920 [Entamoeba invadens IP1]ELP91625.1 hypothetical protein EIN_205920 [Entamoeba invadens IP1]|eukprot:XP_004258396.1 hypothetical protein EIN_205920 [Entamoeba invadens IP1]
MQVDAQQPVNNDKVCGFCNDSESNEKLIRPCACEGLFKYVHPSCLQQYRVFNNDPIGFYRCLNCGVDYTTKQKKDHNLFFLLLKFFTKGLLQFLMMFVYLFLIVFASGNILYAIDTYVTHVLLASNDEKELHWIDDDMWIPRVLIFGAILDCLVLGIITVFGGIVQATSDDMAADELNYRDTERLGACCGVGLCCQPYVWRNSILKKLYLCGWCFCCPRTCPAVTDLICCRIPFPCSCAEKTFNSCCYVTDDHKYHKKGRFWDCGEDGCTNCINFFVLLAASFVFILFGCGSSNNDSGLFLGILFLFLIACAMILFGAFVGIFGVITFVIILTSLNFKFIKRQAMAERTELCDWDETIHPMPTHDAPVCNPQNVPMQGVQVGQPTYSQPMQPQMNQSNYTPGGIQNVEQSGQYVPPPMQYTPGGQGEVQSTQDYIQQNEQHPYTPAQHQQEYVPGGQQVQMQTTETEVQYVPPPPQVGNESEMQNAPAADGLDK